MATVLSRRLGKRSLLGARISAPPLLGGGVLMTTQAHPLQPELSSGSSLLVSCEEGHLKEHADGPGEANHNGPVLHPGQKVGEMFAFMGTTDPWVCVIHSGRGIWSCLAGAFVLPNMKQTNTHNGENMFLLQ